MKRPGAVLVVLLTLPACGGGSSSPSGGPTPAPTLFPTPTPAPPATIVETLGGTLSAGDTVCSSPASIHDNKPCRRHQFTATNSGQMQATLTWSNRNNDLDLELWRGTTRLIGTLGVTTTEDISSAVTPGTYEVRVVYYEGSTTQNYDLRLAHPN